MRCGPFLRELCCVAYRLAASVIVSNTPVKPEKALGKMEAPCVESSSVKKKYLKYTMTLCLSNYGDKCCKLYVVMFGLWLFSRFTPPLRLLRAHYTLQHWQTCSIKHRLNFQLCYNYWAKAARTHIHHCL